MKMKESQFLLIKEQLKKLTSKECFYKQKLEGVNVDQIQSQEDFEKLPFTWKGDLREAYPLGLMTEPEEKIVRIHSSSGTTGTPVIIPYTQQDVDDWAFMFKRCYEMAGITNMDRIQITPGYGLWTAGIGFQLGAERLGAMTVPMGPGNTDKQLRMMMDMKSTVLCATSSYALLLAEEIAKRGIGDKICLKKGVIGSERWGDKMRQRIANELGVDLYDIYGLTEVYGPGIAINCQAQGAMHYWDDFIYLEIVDPKTGEVLPDGEVGEIVITTLRKQGAPLIRYRTHDLSRIVPGECPCGSPYPAHRHPDRPHGRHGEGEGREYLPQPDRGAAHRDQRGFQRISGHGGPPHGQGRADSVCGDRAGRQPLRPGDRDPDPVQGPHRADAGGQAGGHGRAAQKREKIHAGVRQPVLMEKNGSQYAAAFNRKGLPDKFSGRPFEDKKESACMDPFQHALRNSVSPGFPPRWRP